jgi:hypothetical protein
MNFRFVLSSCIRRPDWRPKRLARLCITTRRQACFPTRRFSAPNCRGGLRSSTTAFSGKWSKLSGPWDSAQKIELISRKAGILPAGEGGIVVEAQGPRRSFAAFSGPGDILQRRVQVPVQVQPCALHLLCRDSRLASPCGKRKRERGV